MIYFGSNMDPLRQVEVTRYVTPLREGGSLPAIVEADDNFLYVLKFRGAGQGIKALIAELIGGELARMLDLKVPEIVLASVDPAFGRTEPDEEIQDLLKASEGLNLALHYLSGAITFDPAVNHVDSTLASKIVWLDIILTNVDRSFRNTNMLMWHKELWLIDHGASLYFHHAPGNWEEQSVRPFAQIKDHVLLPQASELGQVNEELKERITQEHLKEIMNLIPDEWLESAYGNAAEGRELYTGFLSRRLNVADKIIKEAEHARQGII